MCLCRCSYWLQVASVPPDSSAEAVPAGLGTLPVQKPPAVEVGQSAQAGDVAAATVPQLSGWSLQPESTEHFGGSSEALHLDPWPGDAQALLERTVHCNAAIQLGEPLCFQKQRLHDAPTCRCYCSSGGNTCRDTSLASSIVLMLPYLSACRGFSALHAKSVHRPLCSVHAAERSSCTALFARLFKRVSVKPVCSSTFRAAHR